MALIDLALDPDLWPDAPRDNNHVWIPIREMRSPVAVVSRPVIEKMPLPVKFEPKKEPVKETPKKEPVKEAPVGTGSDNNVTRSVPNKDIQGNRPRTRTGGRIANESGVTNNPDELNIKGDPFANLRGVPTINDIIK
jgi:hypothetical protein